MILHDARADAAGDLVAAAGSSVINWVSARAVAGPRARTVWCTNSDLELALSLVEATAPTRSHPYRPASRQQFATQPRSYRPYRRNRQRTVADLLLGSAEGPAAMSTRCRGQAWSCPLPAAQTKPRVRKTPRRFIVP